MITGDNYERRRARCDRLSSGATSTSSTSRRSTPRCAAAESPRIKRLSRVHRRELFRVSRRARRLVLLMDESHRYRASRRSKGDQRIEADPRAGADRDAAHRDRRKGPCLSRTSIYRLLPGAGDGRRLREGAGGRHAQEFRSAGMPAEELERIKLEDGVRLHESVKVELERTRGKPARSGQAVHARDRAGHDPCRRNSWRSSSPRLLRWPLQRQGDPGRFSKTGAEEEEMVERLLRVEEPTSRPRS